jgi:bifunctional UDP-N-acetylglucosamine pyrophosphorylase/glucosamine-1-phosphate N-acetyltransferase
MDMADIKIAGTTLSQAIKDRFSFFSCTCNCNKNDYPNILTVKDNLWPSISLVRSCFENKDVEYIVEFDGEAVLWNSKDGEIPKDALTLPLDPKSIIIQYPWQLIDINSEIVAILGKDIIKGTVREGAVIDGNIIVGEGTVILPGVYIEGNAFIGDNCKIGPNCYIRGNTYIGNNCHIGQSVEIKNCVIMDKVNVGHLSYVGDSVICTKTNFGAGTTTANLRHDGKNMQSRVDGNIVDTGRRKLGVICGEDVHTGINTSIYPGRKIWASKSTLPGNVVKKDIK